jgi:D-alanine-D-alanine ligase
VRLEALAPDLVFNTAEGRRGRFREALYPALYEELGLPYTGSDAYVCALTLDKQLTKRVVAAHGVRTPEWVFIDRLEDLDVAHLRLPVIVKPNYEGSSKGITPESIVTESSDLKPRVQALLERYPAGVIVEEFIEGRDVTVPFLEGAPGTTDGILPAAEYVFEDAAPEERFTIYDYRRKQFASDTVKTRVSESLDGRVRAELLQFSRTVVRVLGIRDLGRIDYRVTPGGQVHFLEVNALPSLEPGASLYESAKSAGLRDTGPVLRTVVASAAKRWGLVERPTPRRRRQTLCVGLVYNLKRIQPNAAGEDREAEFDGPATIAAIAEAIRSHGHDVVEFEATAELASLLPQSRLDLAFNVAEGLRGRSREALVPALLELLDIPYTGSDPATLVLTLDKALAKRVVAQAGVPTAPWVVMQSGRERLPETLRFPVIVKPVAEGSSKGVWGASVVETDAEVRRRVPDLVQRYGQPVLVETYLPGREFTVGLLGERRPKILPPMEVVFTNGAQYSLYTFEDKLAASDGIRYDAPARISSALETEIRRVARRSFRALGCRDVARVDVRLDENGRVHFVECNPLPGLTPGWSDLCMIAESVHMDYRTLIGEIMAPAIRRVRASRRTGQSQHATVA